MLPPLPAVLQLMEEEATGPHPARAPDDQRPARRGGGAGGADAGRTANVEWKTVDGAANPYLALGCLVAAGLDGVERHLEPEPMVEGDVYGASALPRLPRSLHEAVARFEASAFAREALGEDVVEHYAHFYNSEQAAFERAVTDWERNRYFERI